MKSTALVALALTFAAGGVQAQSNEELKAMLDQALKTIQDLQGRVKTLEEQQAIAGEIVTRFLAEKSAILSQLG